MGRVVMDFATRQRLYQREYRNATIAFKRAVTRHGKEQARGRSDMSVQQTRRMYLAAEGLRSAHGRMVRAHRDFYGR
jgi:hypothetical protein